MTTAGGRSEVSQEALAQAADWFVDFRVGDTDAEMREGFNAWLRQAPQNVQAYLEIARTYSELPALNPDGNVDAEELIAYARSDANVVTLPTAPAVANSSVSVASQKTSRNRRGLAIAASLFMVVLGTVIWSQLRDDIYSTDIGEQRLITLVDGSTIDLNARTRIRVRITGDLRLVQLVEGQALFKVAKDKARPFVVRSDDTRVRAIGTQFDVYRRKTGTTVTVLEGRVEVVPVGSDAHSVPESVESQSGNVGSVRPKGNRTASAESHRRDGRDARAFVLGEGEQVTISPDLVSKPVQANVGFTVAWTGRMIAFEASPLTEVVEEFNRYTRRKLVIGDSRIETLHISGIYSSTDPASLVRFLRTQQGIEVVETDTEIRI